jgi:ABC-type amino acid transport substrate-binding protein
MYSQNSKPALMSLLAVLLLMPAWCAAQYVEEEVRMPAQLNSLGINITHGLSFASGAIPVNPRIGLVYRRQTAPNRNYRVMLSAQFYDPFEVNEIDGYGSLVPMTDTTAYRRYYSNDEFDVELRAGKEWFKPEKKATPIYGFDIILGHALRERLYGTDYLVLDTSFCAECYVQDLTQISPSNEYNTFFLYTGLDMTVGWKILIKDNWELFLQLSPEIRYYVLYDEFIDLDEPRDTFDKSYLDFRLRLLEVYTSVRF